jgi:hypothetical protein
MIIILFYSHLQLICLQLNMSVIISYLNDLLAHSKYFQHFVALMDYIEKGLRSSYYTRQQQFI